MSGYAVNGVSVSIRLWSWLMHRAPLRGGLTKLSFNKPVNARMSRVRGPIQATMRSGVVIDVDPHDYHGRVLYLFGTNDPKVQYTAAALLRAGDRFLDIGANYSSIGLQLAPLVGPMGQVHLFEPQPELCTRVKEAIRGANIRNATLHEVGLMETDGVLELRRPHDHSGMASFMEGKAETDWLTESLPVRAASTYLPPLVDDAPFGAKIDVEGAEMHIIPTLLRLGGLRFAVFENGSDQADLQQQIREAGLVVYGLERRVFALRALRIDSFDQTQAFHDMLAVKLRSGIGAPARAHPRRLADLM